MCKKFILKGVFYSSLTISLCCIAMKLGKSGVKREVVAELEFDGYRPVATSTPETEPDSPENHWNSTDRNNSSTRHSRNSFPGDQWTSPDRNTSKTPDSRNSHNSSGWESSEVVDSSDDEESTEIFTPTLDEYVESCYSDKLVEFKHWILQSVRKLRLLNDLARAQNMTDNDSPMNDHLADIINDKNEKLNKLKLCLNRRNAAGKTFFLMLFELERFLSTTPSSLLITNSEICENFCDLLVMWLENSCFHIENYSKFKSFMMEFFKNGVLLRNVEPGNPPIKQVFKIWRKSLFFDEKRLELIHQKRDFSKALYFGFLMNRLDEDLLEASFPLKTITEVGQGNIGVFHDYLARHNIPFVGPYKAPDYWGKQIIYYISSCNPTESVANGMSPLYGTFKFPLNSLQLPKEQALNFWTNLEKSPFWLLYFPPLFNSALDPMREQFYKVQE